jgi:hypothetical protein
LNISDINNTSLVNAAILSPLWQTFVSSLEVYESACIHGLEDSFSELADSDGNEQSLESFCVQVITKLSASSKEVPALTSKYLH